MLLLLAACFFIRFPRHASLYNSLADVEVISPETLRGKTVFDVLNDVRFRVLSFDFNPSSK